MTQFQLCVELKHLEGFSASDSLFYSEIVSCFHPV